LQASTLLDTRPRQGEYLSRPSATSGVLLWFQPVPERNHTRPGIPGWFFLQNRAPSQANKHGCHVPTRPL